MTFCTIQSDVLILMTGHFQHHGDVTDNEPSSSIGTHKFQVFKQWSYRVTWERMFKVTKHTKQESLAEHISFILKRQQEDS